MHNFNYLSIESIFLKPQDLNSLILPYEQISIAFERYVLSFMKNLSKTIIR